MSTNQFAIIVVFGLAATCSAEDGIDAGIPGRGRMDIYCGIRCVRDLLGYHDQSVPLMSLIEEARPTGDNEQYSMEDLRGLLARHGIDSFGLGFTSVKDLRNSVPCIIHYRPSGGTEEGHFVLLLEATEPLMTIHDGLLGTRQIRMDDPEMPITKVALVMGRPQEFERSSLALKGTDYGLLLLAAVQAGCVTVVLIRRRRIVSV